MKLRGNLIKQLNLKRVGKLNSTDLPALESLEFNGKYFDLNLLSSFSNLKVTHFVVTKGIEK
jgi:hypothetical protein